MNRIKSLVNLEGDASSLVVTSLLVSVEFASNSVRFFKDHLIARDVFVLLQCCIIHATLLPGSRKVIAVFVFSQEESRSIFEELTSEYSFAVDQLIELSGAACALAITKVKNLTSYYKNNRHYYE